MPSTRASIQFVLLLVAISLAGACKKQQRLSVPEGDIAATLAIPSLTAPTFDTASLKGKPTLVVFASPTCGHCFAELPVAQQAATAESANVVVVYVVGTQEQAKSVTERAKFTAPVLVDTGGTLKTKYDIKAVPYILVLGSDGHAREAFRGEQSEETLRSALSSARS